MTMGQSTFPTKCPWQTKESHVGGLSWWWWWCQDGRKSPFCDPVLRHHDSMSRKMMTTTIRKMDDDCDSNPSLFEFAIDIPA